MVVCRYYQQGTCRYGNNCRNEHTMNNISTGTSIMRQNKTSANVDVATLVKSVQTDMLNSEKGGQWLLSSYSPFKEKPTFPGFEDLLFEEVRLAFYEANAAGTVEDYKRKLQETLQAAAHRVRQLQEPNEHVAQTLLQIYTAPVDVGQCAAPLLPHDALSGAAYAPAAGAAVARDAGVAVPSPFAAGGAAHALAFAPPPPVAPPPPTQPSPFAPSTTGGGGGGGGAFSGGNFFAATTTHNAPPPAGGGGGGNIFASQPAPPTAPGDGIFAQMMQNYPAPTAAANQPPPANVFGGGAAAPAAAPPPAGNIFAQAAQNFVAPPTGLFRTPAASDNPSPFAQPTTTTSRSVAATPAAVVTASTHALYTAASDLPPDALAAYSRDEFHLGFIPVLPPPIDLCG